MVMTLHNDLQLQQSPDIIADGNGVSCVCGYIPWDLIILYI